MAKQQRSRSTQKADGPGRRRVTLELARTWIVSVINPLLEGLRKEQVWLSRQNWSWRYSSGTFDYLWPAFVYIDPPYRDNFTEFCNWYPQAAAAVQGHDSALKELAAECNVAFKRLMDTDDLGTVLYEATTAARNAGVDLEAARGAVPENQWVSLMAEYVINNIRALAEHYSTAAFWKVAGSIVLRARNANALRKQFEAVDRVGRKLLDAAERSQKELIVIRQGYTGEFGLPPVPLSGRAEASDI